ncbi:hypothetical protein [Nannocystis punicea]|uniref:Lipoprotein n=1 Tax=Nannocystis punicea TaxID=2995304 RepID=A0ABY7H2Y2_9BACT|nr:hypothetical protein [Nannocystis poenicansa]WAS93628.1 hypothetical protein O0S08_46445 [Nannocystis poenicansa]
MTTRIHLCFIASTLLACTFEAKLYEGDSPTTDTGVEASESGHSTADSWAGTTLETSGPGPATTTTHPPGWTSDTEGPPETSTTGISGTATEGEGASISGTATEATSTTGCADGCTTGEFPETSTSTTFYTTGSEEPVPCDGEAEPLDVEVLAYLESQIPVDPEGGTTGDDDDPNRLYVRFSSETFTCADPHDPISCGQWELSLRIPAAFQAPGLYSLSWPGVHGFGLENGADHGWGECDGGGSVATGTLEVIALDADKVVGRLCHVKWSGLDNSFELDGKFIAPRCP